MSALLRRCRDAPNMDGLLSIQDDVVRHTAGMVSGGLRCNFSKNLNEGEQSELVALAREAEGDDGRFVLDRLSKRKQQRWEQLVGKGGGDPEFFARHRGLAEIQALAAEGHKASVRRPFARREQETLFEALGDALANGSMSASTLATFVVILLSFERGEGYAPRSRIERDPDGTPVLCVSRAFGLVTERQDWRQSLTAWQQGCKQLAKNSWLEVDASTGNEVRLKLGSRALRALAKARAAA